MVKDGVFIPLKNNMDMTISKKEFDEAGDQDEITEKIIKRLENIGSSLGFESHKEVRVEGGRIDLVWYFKITNKAEGYFDDPVPLVAFEIESSPRTRKHIKGNLVNFMSIRSVHGVIVFLKEGFEGNTKKIDGNMKFAQRLSKRFQDTRAQVWSEEDIGKLETQLKIK